MFGSHFVPKLQLIEKVEKQGNSLVCQFERMMELVDASFKEAPTTNTKIVGSTQVPF